MAFSSIHTTRNKTGKYEAYKLFLSAIYSTNKRYGDLPVETSQNFRQWFDKTAEEHIIQQVIQNTWLSCKK